MSFGRYRSSLKADYNAGVSAITVYSISQFAANIIILIGEFGREGSEILKTHESTPPSGNTVTLASATLKPHSKDDPVYIIPYDQIEFSWSSSLSAAKTILGSSPYNIDPEQEEMIFEDDDHTSGYYFTRYFNSITDEYSDYTDGIIYTGLPLNTVGYAIDTAMNELGIEFDEKLTFGMMISFLRQMLLLIRGKLKTWQKYKVLDQNFGTVYMGVRRYALPSEVYDQYSNRSIASLRVGQAEALLPIDRDEYLSLTKDTAYTEVATAGSAADTSLVLDDTSDLADEGSITVYVSGTKYTITYTTNTKGTNTLSGIPASGTGSITATLPVDSQVWQGVTESEAKYFSVQDGYVYIWPMIISTYNGENLTGDYLIDIEDIDSQMDILRGVKFDCAIPYLKYKIRAIKENSGKEDLKDPSYLEFRELLQDAVKNESIPESMSFRPRTRVVEGGRTSDSRR